eukprot:1152802-Pelagomonas_calceolata.AAC.1
MYRQCMALVLGNKPSCGLGRPFKRRWSNLRPQLGSSCSLASEAVQGAALALQRVHHVQRGHGLALGMLGVGHGVADDVLQEHLEHAARLLVDEAANSLHATTARQAADGGLGDALNVVAQDLAVALGAPLAESLASFATSRHDESILGSSWKEENVLSCGIADPSH